MQKVHRDSIKELVKRQEIDIINNRFKKMATVEDFDK